MSETVWISIARSHGSNQRRMTNSFVQTELQKDAIIWGEKNVWGDPLPPECFPAEIFGSIDAKEPDYSLPHIFYDGNFWVVSMIAADVLRRFDLGMGALYPTKVLKADRQTPIGEQWFCLSFGNKKNALSVSDSVPLRETYVRNGEKAWRLKSVLKDGDIALNSAAAAGPDIWIDPNLAYSFFLSDDLGKALKKAKADKGFFLHKCRLV